MPARPAHAMTSQAATGSWVRWGDDEANRALASTAARLRARRAARAVLAGMQAMACEGRTPVTALVDQFYADVQKMGGNRWDTSSLIKRLT